MGENTKNLALGALVVALLGAAGYFYFRSAGEGVLPTDYRIDGVCLACKQEASKTQKMSLRPPFECPACKKEAVYPWYYCRGCKKRFVPNLERSGDGPPRLPVVPVCVGCGSSNTGAYDPLDTDNKPVGDLPLPKWP